MYIISSAELWTVCLSIEQLWKGRLTDGLRGFSKRTKLNDPFFFQFRGDFGAMMKRITTSSIECGDLARTLELKGASVLLIDCRSFMDFNHCHIINAHNVHFPPIVKRRSGGSVRLERHVLRCPRTRSRLQAGHFSLVVVYDHNSTSLNDLADDSNMNLVLRCLDSEDRIHNLRYLHGK